MQQFIYMPYITDVNQHVQQGGRKGLEGTYVQATVLVRGTVKESGTNVK